MLVLVHGGQYAPADLAADLLPELHVADHQRQLAEVQRLVLQSTRRLRHEDLSRPHCARTRLR